MHRAGSWLGFLVLVSCSSGGSDGSSVSVAGSSAGGTGGAAAGAGGASGSSTGGVSGGDGVSGAAGLQLTQGGAGSGGAPAVACNTLVNAAPAIEEEMINGGPPEAVGGTIVDGTYYETSYAVYSTGQPLTEQPITHRLTAKIEGSSFQAVYLDGQGNEQRISLALMADGTTLKETQTCRSVGTVVSIATYVGYDATPTTLTFHLPRASDQSSVVYRLTKH
jgi:hypothetical protein